MAYTTTDGDSKMELDMDRTTSTATAASGALGGARRGGRRLALATMVAVFSVLSVGVASAAADPLWNLDIHHDETNFPPGGTAEYAFDVINAGDADTSGPVTLKIYLPAGLSRHSFRNDQGTFNGGENQWDCPGSAGDTVVTCTTNDTIYRDQDVRGLIVTVDVAAGAGPDVVTTATVSGGGASDAPAAAGCAPGVGACASEHTHVSADPAPFGIVDGSWIGDFFEADGITRVRQAGVHPDHATFSFDLNSIPFGVTQAGDPQKAASDGLRNATIDLPPGFVGSPAAVDECSLAQLEASRCPASSVAGIAYVSAVSGYGTTSRFEFTSPVFNVTHPSGVISDFGLRTGAIVHVRVSLDPARNYTVRATASDINEAVRPFTSKVVIWGVPADPSHDAARCGFNIVSIRCPTDHPAEPFLTLPAQCGVDNQMKLSGYDSWQQSGVFGPALLYTLPGQMTGCDKPRFAPDVAVHPTDARADSPTGLDVSVSVPQNLNPAGVATPPVKHVEVKLPDGVSLNPAFADGLAGCTPAQIGLKTDDPVECPDSSRIGSVTISTPVLSKPLEGSVYLAQQSANPFGTLFAMYVVAHDTEDRGVLIKIPGRIDLDPSTGQITTIFDDLPELPFDHLTVSIRGGDRAPLVNPSTCGIKTVSGVLNSWSQPDVAIPVSNSYTVTQGPGGGACAPDAGSRPFAPGFAAGTLQPTAGAFSPFSLKLTRNDGEQEFTDLQADLPTGLTAKLAGVAQCSDAAIAAISTAPGSGQGEIDRPSCPAASKIGYVHAGAGSGPRPYYINGSVYLAGPYQGAPFSVVVVTPAVAGSVDLGSVVLRTKLTIDPDDAQVHVDSGAIPTIIQGVPIHLRDVRVVIDRPGFMLNPTSCAEKQFTGVVRAITGLTAPVGDRFQVGDCAGLGLAPKLAISLTGKGQTTDDKHPGVHATVTQPAGQANLKKVVVSLPLSLALDPDNAQALCEFTDGSKVDPTCPKGSIVGKAVARTPILNQPLTGPVYFVKNIRKDPKSGREIRTLPKLVIPLTGENGLRLNLVGTSNVVDNHLVSTFDNIPDAPVSDFTLDIDGGKSGILVVSGADICKSTQVADQQIDGHNGKTADTDVYLQTPACPLKIISKKVGKTSVAVKISGLGAGKVTVSGKGIKKTSKTITKSTVATVTAKRTKGKPGKVTVSFDPTGPAKAHKTTK